MVDESILESKKQQYKDVLSPAQLGKITLPNRVIFPAWQLNYANTDGTVSDKLMKFYTDIAAGGCGLIYTGAAVAQFHSIPFDKIMRADTDEYIPGLKKLFSAIKSHGAVPAFQIAQYGRQSSTSFSGDVLMAPSAIPCPMMSQYDPEYKVREMTLEDIEVAREAYIAGIVRGAEAGADVVEVHVCHGYLLNEFLSPYSNKRTDNYGGSVENRCRLILEIIRGIKTKIGDSAAISVRISGDEFVEDGLKPADYKTIVPLLEKAGMDMLSVSAGVYESVLHIVPPKDMGPTPHVDLAEEIKAFTSVPVCAAGSIFSMDTANDIIAAGKADLIALGRAQMADPFIVKKTMEGRENEISK
ncbi:MAG: NADH:flavin oxidoreductase, partial [bacterium]|nr:NADH:flavin oxidoreductase [bacterium]